MKTEGKWQNKDSEELFRVILALDTLSEAENFLRDLLTESEIIELSKRWKVVRMLEKDISYKVIEKETGMSSTTIARISKWIQEGRGGYKAMLGKLKK